MSRPLTIGDPDAPGHGFERFRVPGANDKPHSTMLRLVEKLGRADLTVYTMDPTRYVFLLGLRDGTPTEKKFVRGWLVEVLPGHAFDGKLKSLEGKIRLIVHAGGEEERWPLPPHLRVEIDDAAMAVQVGQTISFGATGLLAGAKYPIGRGR